MRAGRRQRPETRGHPSPGPAKPSAGVVRRRAAAPRMPAPQMPIPKAPPSLEQASPGIPSWTVNRCASANGGAGRSLPRQVLHRGRRFCVAMEWLTATAAGRLALMPMIAVPKPLLPTPMLRRRAIRAKAILIAGAPSKVRATLPLADRASGEKRRAAPVRQGTAQVLRDGMPMADLRRKPRPMAMVRSPRRDAGRNPPARGAAIISIVIAAAPRRARCRERMSCGPGVIAPARPARMVVRPPDNRGRVAVRVPRAVPGQRFIRMRRASAPRPVRQVVQRRSKAAIPDISASSRAAIPAGLAVGRIWEARATRHQDMLVTDAVQMAPDRVRIRATMAFAAGAGHRVGTTRMARVATDIPIARRKTAKTAEKAGTPHAPVPASMPDIIQQAAAATRMRSRATSSARRHYMRRSISAPTIAVF